MLSFGVRNLGTVNAALVGLTSVWVILETRHDTMFAR